MAGWRMIGLPDLADLVLKVNVGGASLLADSECELCSGNGFTCDEDDPGEDGCRCDCVDKQVAIEIVKRLTEQLEAEYGQKLS